MKNKKNDDHIKTEAETVLSLMGNAWQLGQSAITHRFWLQLNGLGKGGPSKNVSLQVVTYLMERGLIKTDETPDGYRKEFSVA